MMIVGLTGGIGSGKSTVAEMFSDLGVPVYDSDRYAKELMSTSKKLKDAITALLGKKAYEGGELNREYIGTIVFGDASMLEKLNKIVHPAVREHFLNWAKEQDSHYVIQESALIFENGNEDFYDAIILITAPEEIRIKRVIKRDSSKVSDVVKRIKNQMEDSAKKKMAHFHIENRDLETTRKEVRDIHETLIQ